MSGLRGNVTFTINPWSRFGRSPESTHQFMSESFADLFEESLNTIEMAPGAIVTGTVVDIDSDWVIVHAGLKSGGVLSPESQFLMKKANSA